MDVTVVIPTRNRVELLGSTLRSVGGQRGVELEVIVVDDASSDGTPRAVAALGDPRIRVIRHDAPRGPNAARNRGAADASGRWIAFIDDDDLWAPHKLTAQLDAAHRTGRQWAYAGSVNVDIRLRVIHGEPPPDPATVAATLRRYNSIPASASNVVIDAEAFRAQGGFDERLLACEEWDLWLRLLRDGPPACVPDPLVAYRMHRSNAILDVTAIEEGARRIEQIHGTTIDRARFHRWIAQLCLRNGDRRGAARQYMLTALEGAPRDAFSDVTTLVRSGLHRRGIGAAPPRPGGDPDWEALARPWLDDLATRLRAEGERV